MTQASSPAYKTTNGFDDITYEYVPSDTSSISHGPITPINIQIPNINTIGSQIYGSPLDSSTSHKDTDVIQVSATDLGVSFPNSNEEAPKVFIRLMGCPPPVLPQFASSDQELKPDSQECSPNGTLDIPLQTVLPTHAVHSEKQGDMIVDVFDAENEDPFTIETFSSLAEMHAEVDKDFIIARVTTMDPNDVTKLYYSYYAAHHINKVLFRTQPEQGLLHRMKAKNVSFLFSFRIHAD